MRGEAMEAMASTEMSNSDLAALSSAFNTFVKATHKLEDRYSHLQVHLGELRSELKAKNAELEKNLKIQTTMRSHLHNILESLSAGVVVADLNGRVTAINREAEETIGISRADAEGKHLVRDIPILLRILSPDGMPAPGEFETCLRGENGRSKTISVSVSSMKDEEDALIGTIVHLKDITEIKKLKEQAARHSRLAAMGEMAAAMAHEIRNPLGGIELFASLLERDLSSDPDKQRLVHHIVAGVKGIEHTISNLLTFTKTRVPTFRPVEIHPVIEDSLVYADHLIRQSHIMLIRQFNANGSMVGGDAELLKQLALNLIMNATQAMPDGGTLLIRTVSHPESGPESQCTPLRRPRSHGHLEIQFVDSGRGIPQDEVDKIFNPFFTTRERGTGLGLAIVHNIVQAHCGCIEVESTPGKGTIFTVRLPLIDERKYAGNVTRRAE